MSHEKSSFPRLAIVSACVFACSVAAPDLVAGQSSGIITTVAGSGVCCSPGFGGDGAQATSARLSEAYGVAVDGAGNVYIADTVNHRVRKVTASNGVITTIAGTGTAGYNGDGIQATTAQLNQPLAVALDTAGNLYVSDQINNRIRKVWASSGLISTIAGTGIQDSGFGGFGDGGSATSARLNHPFGVTVDTTGNVYIADTGSSRIRKVTAANGEINTFAGKGPISNDGTSGYDGDNKPATSARLNQSTGVALDGEGNLYIADLLNNRIRKVTAATGIITTVAGDGTGSYGGDGGSATAAKLNFPYSVAVDGAGNLYIADYFNYRIRKVSKATGVISTIAGIGLSGYDGDGGPATSSYISDPVGVALDGTGNFYIMDQASYRVRKVTLDTAPSVTAHPSNQQVVPGGPASFSAAASGTPPLTVQWQVSANGGGSWANIGGAVATTYSFTAVLADNGKQFRAVFTNGVGTATTTAATLSVRAGASVPSDLDGDGLSDLVVWRPGSGTWYSLTSGTGYNYGSAGAKQWGSQSAGDVPLMGDIDGDGKADLVVWRAGTGTWYWLTSSTGYNYAMAGSKQWGNQSLGDVPMLGDMDGDGRVDLIVWRASTGTWFWLTSSSGYNYAAQGQKQWGSQSAGDVPKIGDIDGDGKADLVVWRAPTGMWFWLTSSSGYNYAAQGNKQWGSASSGDSPMVGDIDGDGKSDLVVWRAPSGTWFWLTSSSGFNYATAGAKQWGNQGAGDVPLLTDFDGDGKADLTVWRAPSGTWFWLTSSSGYNYATAGAKQWGSQSNGDIPMVK